MRAKGYVSNVRDLANGRSLVELEILGDTGSLNDLHGIQCDVRITKGGKSIRANDYAWVLMTAIAKHRSIRSTKDEVYMRMLYEYGPSYLLPVAPDDVKGMERTFRIVKDRGQTIMTDIKGRATLVSMLECYPGMSQFDKDEMGSFLDGVVLEAQGLGINTDTPDEIEHMKALWKAVHE